MNQKVVQSLKQWKNKQNNNLYDHLCQMFTHMSTDKLNGIQHFQRISQFFKKYKFNVHQPDTQQELQAKNSKQIQYPQWILKGQQLLQKNKKIKETNQRIIQNFQKQTQMLFQPAGVSFGKFWGKILTRNGDYLVIQGRCKKKKQPIISGDMQKYLQGANYYSYWINHDSFGKDWYELPLVTPQQIRISKLIKHVFSGNLSTPIVSYPKFNGQQRHFLKAQLVRITHNCEISPKGLYTISQQTKQQQFGQQFKMPEFGQLKNLQNWVHINPYILNIGRATYYIDPKISQSQRDQLRIKLQTAQQLIDRFKSISEDKAIQNYGFKGCWLAKEQGNLQIFNAKEEGSTNCYGIVTLKNPNWPGWLTVANMKGFGSIYIGYGYKLTQQCFYPISPQDLEVQGQDVQQFEQPNPKQPPDELQPDSDDENKKLDQ